MSEASLERAFREAMEANQELRAILELRFRTAPNAIVCVHTGYDIKPGEVALRKQTMGGDVSWMSNKSDTFAFWVKKKGLTLDDARLNKCAHGQLTECELCRELFVP